MRPQINYVYGVPKTSMTPSIASTVTMRGRLISPFVLYQWHTPLDFFSKPVRHLAFLRALSVTCEQFAAIYRSNPAAAVYAIQYVMDDSLLTTGGRYAYSLTAEQIAQEIYQSCLGSAAFTLYRGAGLPLGSVAGVGVGSVLIGAALGALAMHLSMK